MAQTILELLGMASGATPPPGDGRQSLTSYEPTMRDKLANWLLGETPSQIKKDFVQGLVGSRGMGATGMGLVDFTPAGVPMQSQEGYREHGLQGAAMPFIGSPAGKIARKFGDATEHAIGQIGASLEDKAAYYVKHGKEFVVHASDNAQPLIKLDSEKAANAYVDEFTKGSPTLKENEKKSSFLDKDLYYWPKDIGKKQDLSVTETKIKGALDIPVPPAPSDSEVLSDLMKNTNSKKAEAPSLGHPSRPFDMWQGDPVSHGLPPGSTVTAGDSGGPLGIYNGTSPVGIPNVSWKKQPTGEISKNPVWDYEKMPGSDDYQVFDAKSGKIHQVVQNEQAAWDWIGKQKEGNNVASLMKLAPAPFPKSIDPVKQMLAPGDLKKVEDRYRQAIGPLQPNFPNFPPRALEQGYETPAFRGMKIYGKDEPNPVYKFDSDYGQMYSSDNPMLADMYSDYKLHHPGWDVKAGDFGEGSQVSPLLLNTKDYHYYDAQGGDWRAHNSRAMDEARKLGKRGVIVDNVRDEPNSTENLPSPSKVFITFPSGASTAKSRFAERFDPTSPNMLHGIPVGAMIGSGLIMGQDGRPHKIEHMPEGYDPFASQNPENGT